MQVSRSKRTVQWPERPTESSPGWSDGVRQDGGAQPWVRKADAPVFGALLMVVVLSAPMVRRPEIAPIRRAEDLLKTLNQEQASKKKK